MFHSILLFCLIEKCREVESEWGQSEMDEMDRQGRGLGWGHVLSVTSGSMHYIVQDELSNATFMYIYICLSYVCEGEQVKQVQDEVSAVQHQRVLQKTKTKTWNSQHGGENVKNNNSPCVCNFVFLTPPPPQGAPVFPQVSHRRRSSGYGPFQRHRRQQHPLQPHHGEQGGAGEGRHGCRHTQQDSGATTGSGCGVWT